MNVNDYSTVPDPIDWTDIEDGVPAGEGHAVLDNPIAVGALRSTFREDRRQAQIYLDWFHANPVGRSMADMRAAGMAMTIIALVDTIEELTKEGKAA
jgi:hypothetical protein